MYFVSASPLIPVSLDVDRFLPKWVLDQETVCLLESLSSPRYQNRRLVSKGVPVPYADNHARCERSNTLMRNDQKIWLSWC